MATPEEIKANIAASQARKEKARQRDADARAERERLRLEAARHPQEEWHGKLVGFIVRTRKGKFKPIVAKVFNSEGDRDSILFTVGAQDSMDSLDEARDCFLSDSETEFERVFLNPVAGAGMMGNWLNQVLAANPTQ